MPKLPTAESFGQRPTQIARKQILSADGGAVGAAAADLGQTVSRIGQSMQDREDRMALSMAKAKFNQALINTETLLEQDNDYKTYPQRYGEAVTKAKKEAANTIQNGYLRQAFEIDADTEIVRGSDRMTQRAMARERDHGVASLQEIISLNRENALRAGDDATAMASLNAVREAVTSAQQNGYIDESQAQQIQQRTAIDYATARASMLPPQARIDALKSARQVAPIYVVGKPAGMIDAGNINLAARPVVKNKDGSISTVNSMSFQEEKNGPEILIPTVVGNRVVSPKEAIAHYHATGEHLGKFKTPDEATAYAQSLHEQQDKLYSSRGSVYDVIPTDKRHMMIERAKTQIKQESALLRVGLSEKVQDATAAYLEGLTYDNPPSRSDFVAAYPDDGDKRYEQFSKTQKLGETLSLVANAAPEDRRRILETQNPKKDVVGAGFAADKERFGVLVRSVQSMERELAGDPAAYAIKHSDPVRQAYEASQKDPDTLPDYIKVATAEQQRLGAPSVKLLPEQHAKAIAAQFNNPDGENAAALIESMASDWGSAWPTVYKQLSKDLPPAALVIGSGVDPATAELLARTAHVKTDELKKGIDKSAVSDADKAVDEAMSDFQVTLSAQGGQSTYAKLNEQAKRLTYTYMSQGTPASEASERAYRVLVEDKYNIVDTYRVPKQFDVDAVQAGSESALESLDVSQFSALAPQGLSADFITGRIKSALSRDGKWITNEDESGLVLTLNGSVVTDKAGKRIERSFDELTAEGTAKVQSDRERLQNDIRERR